MCGLHVVLTLGVNTASGTPVTCDCYYTSYCSITFFPVELKRRCLSKCSCCSFTIEGESELRLVKLKLQLPKKNYHKMSHDPYDAHTIVQVF